MRKDPEQIAFARQLRRQQTQAEQHLWQHLSGKQLNGAKFRRQQPIGPYVVDFVNFERRVVVEVDGGQHGTEAMETKDEKRTAFLEGEGYQVLRFWNNEVLNHMEGVLEQIREALEHPHPVPLPFRGREHLLPPPGGRELEGGGWLKAA